MPLDRQQQTGHANDAQAETEEESTEEKVHALRTSVARHRRWVQRKADGRSAAGPPPGDAQAAADGGFSGSGGKLPHGERIQAAFGDHDVGGVQAFTGGAAAKASDKLGAQAYASGSKVAFRDTPDLHTAAHEAAHVVQQRAGQGPAGGMDRGAGDTHERHADQVADAVVRGHSAKPLLDQLARGAGGGRAIQRKGGSTDGVQVQQGLPGQGGNYQHALDQQSQAGNFKRDGALNNEDKVALEAELSGAIMRNLPQFGQVVYKVSRNVLRYLQERDADVKAAILTDLQKLVGEPPYYGRMGDDPTTKGPIYAEKLQHMLASGSGPVFQHIGAHGQFLVNVYAKDAETREKGKSVVQSKAAQILSSKKRGFEGPVAPRETEELKDKQQSVPLAGTQSTAQPFKDRGREKTDPNAKAVDQQQGLAPKGGKVDSGADNKQQHQRGTDVWTTQESNLFVQHARLVLDMPMSGGGISGTTAELLQCARVLGVGEARELTQYGLACFAQLGGAGAHSFHEVMSVVALAGGNYSPGDYTGALTIDPGGGRGAAAGRPALRPLPRRRAHAERAGDSGADQAADGRRPRLTNVCYNQGRVGGPDLEIPANPT